MAVKKVKAPKIPKGFKPDYTSYELVTKTTYSKPWKPTKASRTVKPAKEYVQPVKIVGGLPKPKRAKKGGR